MRIRINTKKDIEIRRMVLDDIYAISDYLSGLKEESKLHFYPHAYDSESIYEFHVENKELICHIGEDNNEGNICAYSLLLPGCVMHDKLRIKSLGLQISEFDLSWAPSVANKFHGSGLSTYLFSYLLQEIKSVDYKRIFLWGGVNTSNKKAINYYQKLGFIHLGNFNHKGINHDMVYKI